ncbi:MAG: cation-efflux pump [Methanomassiliicoccales archaeon]|nr:MAG: cation-efflux pump [Methanomassiliicoccales archaeon]
MSLIPDYGDPSNPEVRARYGYLESAVGLIGNSSLFIAKLFIGLLISSVALFGDSLNHLTDLGISFVLLFGFRLAKKEADKEHPFGHARAENILSIVVATLVVAMGLVILITSALGLTEPVIRGSLTVAVVVLAFALVKESMARFAFAVADRIDSKALRADGWNHRFDAIISVVIAVGIYLSTLDPQLRIIDPVLGIVVAIFVMYTGIRLIKETGDELLGRTPSEEVLRAVREVASQVEGVEDAHDVLVHDYGTYKTMSLHVTVKESMTAGEAHDIASEVETAMKDRMSVESVVHIEPKQEIKDVKELEKQIEEVISGYKEVLSSHNIRVIPHGKGGKIDMHILIDKHTSVEDAHKLVHDISSSISRRLPDHEISVHVEPCGGECEICQEICSRGFEKKD